MVNNHSSASPTEVETPPTKPMNVYIVWSGGEYEPDYYLFIAAHSHSHAKYEYARFGGWEFEYFEKYPAGFYMCCHLVEKDAPYEGAGEIWGYEETHGVDLILSGVLQPTWMIDSTWTEAYNRWDGFRKPLPNELELWNAGRLTPPKAEG